METETEPIQKYESSEDMVYFSFITEYGKYIPNDLDKTFSNLMNNIDEYNKYQGNYINLIKENLKLIDNIDFLDTKVTNNYIDFNGRPEENLRLSMLLPKIIKLRQIAYKKAYFLASDLVLGNIPDYELHEDFLLANKVIRELPLENFYADLRIYYTENTIDRFFNECFLIDLVCNALNGKSIALDSVNELEHNLYKIHTNIFDYLKRRYVKRNKILEKR